MKNLIIIIGMILFSIGCGQKLGNYYFDFDTVDWYSIEINIDDLLDFEGQSNLTKNQKLQYDLIMMDEPESENDTLFIQDLEKIGFEKIIIKKEERVNLIHEIVREKSHQESLATACVAVYRDIFIFRKDGEVIGIAKICFDCWKSQIHGTTANTMDFGQSGDYSKLAGILKK